MTVNDIIATPPNELVSVGIPVYNGGKWIEQTIQTFLNQSHKHIELIIADNSSTDNTGSICQHYASLDKRIQYIRNYFNIGIYANHNLVFTMSRGKYFMWGSSNDFPHEEMIERCVSILENNPHIVLCYPQTTHVSNEQVVAYYINNCNLMSDKPTERFKDFNNKVDLMHMVYGVFRRSALEDSILNKEFWGSDRVLMSEITLRGKIMQLPEFLHFARMDDDATCKAKTPIERWRHAGLVGKKSHRFQLIKYYFYLFAVIKKSRVGLLSKLYLVLFVLWKLIKVEILSKIDRALFPKGKKKFINTVFNYPVFDLNINKDNKGK